MVSTEPLSIYLHLIIQRGWDIIPDTFHIEIMNKHVYNSNDDIPQKWKNIQILLIGLKIITIVKVH